MNTSQFMDKQIMDLSNSQSNSDFIDLMNPKEEHIGGGKKEEIVVSYDFQPIRPMVASQQSYLDSPNVGGTRVWSSADSKTNTNTTGIGIRNYSSLDSIEPAKVVLEKDHAVNNAELLSEIDRTMKKHADNLLHALEGLSARISQLESRARHLENSMDDLKVSVGNNHGSTDGKLRQLENVLREVQAGVQVIRDKQEILDGQLHLAKLQISKVERQPETQNSVQSDSLHHTASAPQQSHMQLPPPTIIQPPPTLSLPNAPPPAPQQILLSTPQLPNQFPTSQAPSVPQREPYFPAPPSQTQEPTNQQYQLQLPVPAPPQQQCKPPPSHPQYSQPPPPPQQHPSLSAVSQPQHQPSLGHHLDEAPPYAPPQNYPPSLSQPPPPPSGNPPSQQFYGPPPPMYEPPSNRPNSGYSTAYGPPPSGTNEPYRYSGSASLYGGGGGGSMKQQQLSSAAAQGGGGSYPQLPTARVLPHALPTASGVGGGSGSPGTGNRVPIDDVVDKVTNMGFSRDQVRATVRKLTENGQSVDLNVVLDKLMNDGEGQPPRGWFGR
ncbi:basic salivary proline-rich-like protein [Actinidia rufa]|uniref:Basic salivary proline-rich-like protein n=1 Tax=Actinidia rufa TaxID=165716 RepID=A0A7J0EMK3_9ERIC|nr:basic salivary proline-rich-like protein [Actinidia rufa]